MWKTPAVHILANHGSLCVPMLWHPVVLAQVGISTFSSLYAWFRQRQMDMLVWDTDVFNSLALRCDGQHQRAQWRPSLQNGVVSFPTAQEASYPRTLCKRVAQCIVEACRLRGSVFPLDAFKPQQRLDETKIPGKRGVKTLPSLVSEYSLITDVHPTNADFKVILPTSIEKWGNSTNNGGDKSGCAEQICKQILRCIQIAQSICRCSFGGKASHRLCFPFARQFDQGGETSPGRRSGTYQRQTQAQP